MSGVDCWSRECIGETVAPAELEVDPVVLGVPVHVYTTLISYNE